MTAPALPAAVSARMHDLLELLRRDGDRVFGSRRIQVTPVSFEVREWSEVARARVTTPTGVRHVFAKVYKPRGPGEAAREQARAGLRRDFDVTSRVFEAFKGLPELRVVEPLACYEQLLGVVTKEASGLPLEAVVAKNAAWPAPAARIASLEAALTRVGRWVAAFQQLAPGLEPSPMDLDAIREYIDVRLKKLTELPRAAFSQADRQAVLGYFDRRAAEIPPSELIDVPVHGDITPSNIMATADAVTVLDFGMTARGSRYLDISRLYTQLEFYTAKPQFRPQTIATLQQAALTGFDPGLRADNPLFEICAVQHVVCHLLSHTRRPGPFPASVYSVHQCRRHRRWLRDRARSAALRAARPQATVDSLR